jgi:uncharacterized protein YeaO (DUF488 family)
MEADMILTKHLFDPVEQEDGRRLWIEPLNLTADLRRWCRVNDLVPGLAPRKDVWEWFQEHPDGYEYFRAAYHMDLQYGPAKRLAEELAWAGVRRNFTLLHQGDDPQQNSATALYEFLSELQAYIPPGA